ncbi:hypothetical protein [Azospirillum melinis]
MPRLPTASNGAWALPARPADRIGTPSAGLLHEAETFKSEVDRFLDGARSDAEHSLPAAA